MKMTECKWCRRGAITVTIIVVLLVVLRVFLNPIAVAVANRVLPKALNTPAELRDIDISLLSGKVVVEGITIEQPPGFVRDGQVVFFGLAKASVDISVRSLFTSKIVIQEIAASDIEVRVVKNKEGELSSTALAKKPDADAPPTEEEPAEEAAEKSAREPGGKAVEIRVLAIENACIFYLDESMGDDALRADIIDLNVLAGGLILDMGGRLPDTEPGELMLTARIVQEKGDAMVGAYARIMPITSDNQTVNAAVRVIGVELDSFAAAIPPGVATTIGGNCVDVYVDASMHPELLDVVLQIGTSDNKLTARVEGTPKDPKVDKSAALFAVFGRFGGGIGNVAMSAGEAGVEAADAAIDTVAAAGKGAAKTVGTMGKGLFKTLKGVATADLKGAAEGLKGATIGTVSEAVATVADTAGAVAEGVGDTASAAVGAGAANEWRETKQTRWEETWASAQAQVKATPLPATREQTVAIVGERETLPVAAPATNVVEAVTESVEPAEPEKATGPGEATESSEEEAPGGEEKPAAMTGEATGAVEVPTEQAEPAAGE